MPIQDHLFPREHCPGQAGCGLHMIGYAGSLVLKSLCGTAAGGGDILVEWGAQWARSHLSHKPKWLPFCLLHRLRFH